MQRPYLGENLPDLRAYSRHAYPALCGDLFSTAARCQRHDRLSRRQAKELLQHLFGQHGVVRQLRDEYQRERWRQGCCWVEAGGQ